MGPSPMALRFVREYNADGSLIVTGSDDLSVKAGHPRLLVIQGCRAAQTVQINNPGL